ncbi:hypothetical protein AKUH3B111A_00380 [Apilactobacillus kunkeei]|nr:hypothetical protein AKUH3B104X_00380 [Apilactobacillus kunkeei]CAI2549767.1 hypothetical protein AKUH3B103M_00380 [Apilactobacillus kunkeei]CAI2549818.1 hypothetical protein AKUH3B111A_00380 [Apilactobacillus kunkeei]CAI2603948.1 hypothetical protein AKUA2103_00360 [Apilactobacillus kunkeei]CAI2605241.1 hypothetical protein AKUA1003_00360 [Apilactobacillus kunkeei]
MKIKKSFFAIMAVLTLFAASASTSISSFTSVEANAATHHKNEKKHKKAKKSSKKHKKTTKKSKKKATKKSKKKDTKKHSKKKVARKKKNTRKKNTPKKHQGKRLAPKTKKTHVVASNIQPTISINDGSESVNVAYSSVQDKSYDNIDLKNVTSVVEHDHDLKLRGISYYKLTGSDKFKTAVTLKLQFQDYDNEDQYVASSAGTYLVNSNGQYMYASWGVNHGDFTPTFVTVPSNSSQFVNLTFYSSLDLPLSSFSTFDFVYDVSSVNFGTTINF